MSKRNFKTRTRQQNVETQAPVRDEELAMDFVDAPDGAMETKKIFDLRKVGSKVKVIGKKLAKPALLTAVASGVGVASSIIYAKVTGNEISLISLQDKSEIIEELKDRLDDAACAVSEVAEAASEEA